MVYLAILKRARWVVRGWSQKSSEMMPRDRRKQMKLKAEVIVKRSQRRKKDEDEAVTSQGSILSVKLEPRRNESCASCVQAEGP